MSCALDEEPTEVGCLFVDDEAVSLHVDAGEPVRIRWTLGDTVLHEVAPRGSATLVLGDLEAATAYAANLELEGTSGAVARWSLPITTHEPLATLSIVEVRADPRGPEPTQEYVEVLNFGAVPIPLDGFTLSDRADAAGDVLTGTVAPGERVLVVADRFDPEDPNDPAVPPGVRLVRVEGPIASGGISNAGEPLFLRDPEGRRVSAAPAEPSEPGVCLVRTGASMRGARGFTRAVCTPGVP